MNIRKLTFDTNEKALELLQLQMSAYRVEAELIGFDDIPPLKDSVDSIRKANEVFYGAFAEDELAGAISYETGGNEITICRVMVHPHHFRQGIASALLRHVLELASNTAAARVYVSTGAKNEPAIRLYLRHGFRGHSRREIGPGIELVTLVKEMEIASAP